MGGVGRARGKDLELQGAQIPATHGRTQVLTAHGVPVLAQLDLQPAGAVATLLDTKSLYQSCFPLGRFLRHGPRLLRFPRTIPIGRHPEHLAEPPHRVLAALSCDEAAATHWSGVCEITRLKRLLAMAFF